MTLVDDHKVADSIIGFVRNRFPAAGDALSGATPLLDGGILDSLGVLELMSFLAETYGIEIADEDFVPANFETIEHLACFVERKRVAP